MQQYVTVIIFFGGLYCCLQLWILKSGLSKIIIVTYLETCRSFDDISAAETLSLSPRTLGFEIRRRKDDDMIDDDMSSYS